MSTAMLSAINLNAVIMSVVVVIVEAPVYDNAVSFKYFMSFHASCTQDNKTFFGSSSGFGLIRKHDRL